MRLNILLLALLALSVFSAQAKPQYGTVTVSKVINVYDDEAFFEFNRNIKHLYL